MSDPATRIFPPQTSAKLLRLDAVSEVDAGYQITGRAETVVQPPAIRSCPLKLRTRSWQAVPAATPGSA